MKKIILIILWIAIVVTGILQVFNNLLDVKYIFEPFEKGDDILELQRLSKQKILDNTYTITVTIFLFIAFTISIFWTKSITKEK
jgi:hypothetical protein